jgi:outer membrane protein assembly factor BamB
LTGSAARWSFGDGTLVTAPVTDGGVVFEGSSNGTVYGISIRTGKLLWHRTAGSTIEGQGSSVGMAVGGDLLVVPAGPVLTAFGD